MKGTAREIEFINQY